MTFDLDLWPTDHMNIWRFPYYINKPSLVQIGLQLFKWGHFHIFSLSYNLTSDDLWPWYMTFDHMNIWRLLYHISKPSLVPIGLQLLKWGHFHIFSLSYNLTSDDLWPWCVTFDRINKWRFPCCTFDPTLVEIHESIWKFEPNVNQFSQQTTTTETTTTTGDKVILCIFPAKAGDTKISKLLSFNINRSFICEVCGLHWKLHLSLYNNKKYFMYYDASCMYMWDLLLVLWWSSGSTTTCPQMGCDSVK